MIKNKITGLIMQIDFSSMNTTNRLANMQIRFVLVELFPS